MISKALHGHAAVRRDLLCRTGVESLEPVVQPIRDAQPRKPPGTGRGRMTGTSKMPSAADSTYPAAAPATVAPAFTELDFALAVHQALQDYARPDRLRHNPLIASRIIKAALEKSPSVTPTQALRELLAAHCAALGQSPKYANYRRVLEQTYLVPLRKRRMVADALRMSWATYRRYLLAARAMLSASLWEAECNLRLAGRNPAVAVRRPFRARIPRIHRPITITGVLILTVVSGLLLVALPHKMAERPVPAHTRPAAMMSADSTLQQASTRMTLAGTTGYAADADIAPLRAQARALYLIGREYLSDYSRTGFRQSLRYFHESTQIDPAFGPAWAALAAAYALQPNYDDRVSPDANYANARLAASTILAINPAQPDAHAVLGLLDTQHWQWRQAQREFQLAVRLDPYSASTQQWYARFLWFTGHPRRALTHMRRAYSLDPRSAIISAELGRALIYAGALSQARAQLLETIEQKPGFVPAYACLIEDQVALHQYRQAITSGLAADRLAGGPHLLILMQISVAESRIGDQKDARKYLNELHQWIATRYVSNVVVARMDWELQDRNQTFEDLQRAARDHDPNLLLVGGPDWAAMRNDPRFATVRKLMNLPAPNDHPW